MRNRVVLIRTSFSGLLRLVRADEYSISDGELLGFLDPEAFNADDLREMYEDLTPSEDFEIEPLNYSGDDFNAMMYDLDTNGYFGGMYFEWNCVTNESGYVKYFTITHH